MVNLPNALRSEPRVQCSASVTCRDGNEESSLCRALCRNFCSRRSEILGVTALLTFKSQVFTIETPASEEMHRSSSLWSLCLPPYDPHPYRPTNVFMPKDMLMLFACLTPPLPKGAATVRMPFPAGWFSLLWSHVRWNPTVCPGQSLALSLLQFAEVLPCCSI